MEESRNSLMMLIENHNLTNPQGVKAFLVKDACFIFMWCGNKLNIFESCFLENRQLEERVKSKRSEVNLKSCVIDIFQMKDDCISMLDENGVLHGLELTISDQINYMEVEDLFSSPSASGAGFEWKEKIVKQFSGYDGVIQSCVLSSDLAILAVKDDNLSIVFYSLLEYNLKFVVDLKKYGAQEGVISSCEISSMAEKLKQHFKENLEIYDKEIIVIGLVSGLVLWFCVNNPLKGPFVLFHSYQKVRSIHWIKDSKNEKYKYLLILLRSGQIVVFGEEKQSELYLPDSVKSSCCLKNFIVSSNYVDCYSSEIQLENNLSLNNVSLPVKGVCAMTCAPGSDVLIIAASVHGSVYCFDPTVALPTNTSDFVLPDQSLLDNMFLQSQNLEIIYKQLTKEEEILKAVSTTVAANCGVQLFSVTVKVVSDGVISVTAKVMESKVIFLCPLWSVCVEVINENGRKEISFHNMKEDFSCSNDLSVTMDHCLSVGDVVSVELLYFIENQQPLLIVPVGKVEIDACHLMSSRIVCDSTSKTEETLENILENMKKTSPKQTLSQCKLTIKLPTELPVNSVFRTVLDSSQQRFTPDEWEKLSSGRKLNVSVDICTYPVLLNVNMESREFTVTSSNAKLCHQVKSAVVKRLKSSVKKCIPEKLALNLQAIHQSFEIESLKEEPSIETLDSLRKTLRASVSADLVP